VSAVGRSVWDRVRPFTLVALAPPRNRAANSSSAIERSVPAMTKRPALNSMSLAEASSTCDAICLPRSMMIAADSVSAAPTNITERDPPLPPPNAMR